MDRVILWLTAIAIGFIVIMTPIVLIASFVAGIAISVGLYVMGFIELAGIMIFIAYKVLSRKNAGEKLKSKLIPSTVAACVVSLVLGLSLSPLIKFEGQKSSWSSSYSSSYSYSGRTGSSGSRNTGSSGGYTSTRTTSKPRVTPRPAAYTGSSRRTPKPERTVNPEDHDIESYYLDYQDEFEDEDDAWDDFEDDDFDDGDDW